VCSRGLPLSEVIPNSAAGYLLETPCIRRYSFTVTPVRDDVTVGSDNPTGAVNQQERPGAEQWVVGFVDGEGCFSISVVRNHGCRFGWQVQHEFAVTQAASSRPALELLVEVFGCGRIIEQHRPLDHRQTLLRFSVKRRGELVGRVVPFFEANPLRTAKRADFERFAHVLQMMEAGQHRSEEGLRAIAAITQLMNRRQRSRYLESSEAIRQPPRTTPR
jgi:LAGLIDADG endonuclease